MRLTDLNPRWVGAGGEGVTRDGQPVPERHGIGVTFDCPCGCDSPVFVPFANPLDGGKPHLSRDADPAWQRTGDTFETLTLVPSIQRVAYKQGGCVWHGFVTDGEVRTV